MRRVAASGRSGASSGLVRPGSLHFSNQHFQLKKEVPASVERTKLLNEKGSQSDVPLDKPSTAPDAASREGRPGKRSLPIPGKVSWLGLQGCPLFYGDVVPVLYLD